MIQSVIILTQPETSVDMQALIHAETGNRFLAGTKLMQYIRSLMGGARSAVVQIAVNALKASGTVTLSSHDADDTVTVNGVVFTCVASGAAGAQYNKGADDTETAANLAAAINAHATLDGMLIATSLLGVVTLTALLPGELGNAVTLAISAHGSVSAARMAGGTNGEVERTHYYGSAS
jgi:phage tail sheath gpL-like